MERIGYNQTDCARPASKRVSRHSPRGEPRPAGYNHAMRNTAKFLSAGAFALLLALGPSAQPAALHAQGQQGPPPATPAERAQVAPAQPTFRVNIDLITTDMI